MTGDTSRIVRGLCQGCETAKAIKQSRPFLLPGGGDVVDVSTGIVLESESQAGEQVEVPLLAM